MNNEIIALANEKVKKNLFLPLYFNTSSADTFELFSFFISTLFPQDFGGNIDLFAANSLIF